MKYLFVDNFRGFAKTLLPVKDVNFLVGENSTGKTSLLALIKLLSSPRFWLRQAFDTEEVELDQFEDIVSVSSPDRNYFRIGLIEPIPREEKNKGPTCEGFLMTFTRKEGLPIISRYTYISEGKQIHARFAPKTIKFKKEDLPRVSDDIECIEKIFLSWVENHQEKYQGYTTLKKPIPFSRRRALAFFPVFLEDIQKEKAEDRDSYTFRLPEPFEDIVWLAPIRTRPKRTYDKYKVEFSPEGDHTPYLIRRLLARKKSAQKFLQFVQRFGKASGLLESISVKNYGRSTTAPFELDVLLDRKALLHVGNVGYGVSQSLPLIVELFARPKKTCFALQQPEIHLHPRAQTALGDVFFELAVSESKKFIIETHSDFLIDSFRLNYRKKDVHDKPDAQIVFFMRSPKGNNVLHIINILENGELPDTQPKAYREFFIREQMRLLGL